MTTNQSGKGNRAGRPVYEKGIWVVGVNRVTVRVDFVERYRSGESIRALVAYSGRSYGFVHQVLTEGGVRFRSHGGVDSLAPGTTRRRT